MIYVSDIWIFCDMYELPAICFRLQLCECYSWLFIEYCNMCIINCLRQFKIYISKILQTQKEPHFYIGSKRKVLRKQKKNVLVFKCVVPSL